MRVQTPAEVLLPIYDTMTDRARWAPTLDVVAAAAGAVGSGLYTRRLDERPYDFSVMRSSCTMPKPPGSSRRRTASRFGGAGT